MRIKIKKTPKLGDYRSKRRFAFIPKIVYSYGMKEKYYIWLEFYIKNEQYTEIAVHIEGVGVVPDERWVTINNFINKTK